jgi:GMP synthase (glutamine-hydrolysing)
MILLISTCSQRLSEDEFVRPVAAIVKEAGMQHNILHYSEIIDPDLKIIDSAVFDKVIICGTALADNEYLLHLEKFSWIRNCQKPILGICSGMQIIGTVFGARITGRKEIGMIKIKTLVKNSLFAGGFDAFVLHGNGLAKLEEFEALAKSGRSIQAIRHRSREVYGVMFHPEVRQEYIIRNFCINP